MAAATPKRLAKPAQRNWPVSFRLSRAEGLRRHALTEEDDHAQGAQAHYR
jgi:hypothetical protein